MKTISQKSIERYAKLYNKLQALNFDLSSLDSITPQQFNQIIGQSGISEGQYKLAKSLARNIERQHDINNYLTKSNIPKTIIPQIKEKEYIKPYKRKKPRIGGGTPIFFNPNIPLKFFKFEQEYKVINQPSGFGGKISYIYNLKKNLKKIGINAFRIGDVRINNFMTEIYNMITTDLAVINNYFLSIFKLNRMYNTAFTFAFELYNPANDSYSSKQTLGQKTRLCSSTSLLVNEQYSKLNDIENRFNMINKGKKSNLLYHIYATKIIISFYFKLSSKVQVITV